MSNKNKKEVSKRQQQIREIIAERKRETREGSEKSRRLWFVTTLIKNSGMTKIELGKIIGMTAQNLHYLFDIQDDCYLSTLKNILKAIGIDCKVRFDLESTDRTGVKKDKPKYSFTGNVSVEPNGSPTVKVNKIPESANVRFLADLLIRTGMTARQLAVAAQIPPSTVMRFFESDDIKISYLCRIAEATGKEIIWDLNEK